MENNGICHFLKYTDFLHGKWQNGSFMESWSTNFTPHFPHGKWQVVGGNRTYMERFQSTLPSREVTAYEMEGYKSIAISIHTSLTGSDNMTWETFFGITFQSTLPSREVTMSFLLLPLNPQFQSTLPSREVTLGLASFSPNPEISIHTSLTGSDDSGSGTAEAQAISIHTSLTGSDCHYNPG